MDPYVVDWLNLLIRWLHITAAIAWIGTSFYFIALDYHLLPPREPRDIERGVGGESWEIHGGGFYRQQKFKIAPDFLPEPLYWFKWEAYTTWISGFALLVVLYYFNPGAYLIDRSVADLAPWQAVAISAALLAIGWVVYDLLCKLVGRYEWLLAVLLFLFITVSAYVSSHFFSGRAVYIQVGAMVGTWMVANVLFVIIPGQKEMVRAMIEGREPEAHYGISGKQRSVHNNYLTLPVIFAMLSNHFPMTYGHQHGWLVLIAIMGISAWFRHFFNLRHLGRMEWGIPASATLAMLLLAFLIWPNNPFSSNSSASAEPVPIARVQEVVMQRCVGCHAEKPTQPGFAVAPKGVMLETAEQISSQAQLIHQQSVTSKAMPLGNLTDMTQAERDLIGAWYRQGARRE